MEIPLRRGRLDVLSALMLVAYAVVAAVLVAVAVLALHDVPLVIVLVVLLLLWAFWSGLYVFNWWRMRHVEHPLALTGPALVARSPFGQLTVPWEAVRSARFERRWNGPMLRVRLVPATDPQFAGVGHADLHPKVFSTVQEKGLRMSLAILDTDAARLREAVLIQSGGRVQVT